MKYRSTVIKGIQLTEKGTAATEKANQYFFRVDPTANKMEIKEAVEDMFKVSVVRVNTMQYAGKKKRERTAKYGRTAHWKRAVVTLEQGSKIEVA